MRLLAALLFLLPLAAETEPKRAPEMEALVGRTRTLPAEFAADGLLRIGAIIADPKWKKELLEEAFQTAYGAQWPVKRHVLDSPQLDRAYAQGLDRLSLQARALETLLGLDPRRAQELFLQMPALVLKPLTCDDHFVYDVVAHYQLLGAILQNTFTARELREERHIALAVAQIAAVQSPAQLAPLARMIESLGITQAQRATLQAAYKGIKDQLTARDRKCAAEPQPKPCESPACRELATKYSALVFGPDGLPLDAVQRAKSEWRASLDEYLNVLRQASSAPFSDVCKLYSDVGNLAPDTAARERILRSLLAYLRNGAAQQEGRAAWFLPVNSMLARVFTDRETLAAIAAEMRGSDQPVIAFYAEMEARYPRPLRASVLLF